MIWGSSPTKDDCVCSCSHARKYSYIYDSSYWNVETDRSSFASSAPVIGAISAATRELQQLQRLLERRNRLKQLRFICIRHSCNIYCNTRATTPDTTLQQTATASLHLHRSLAQHLLQRESCSSRNAYWNFATDCNNFASSAPVTSMTTLLCL